MFFQYFFFSRYSRKVSRVRNRIIYMFSCWCLSVVGLLVYLRKLVMFCMVWLYCLVFIDFGVLIFRLVIGGFMLGVFVLLCIVCCSFCIFYSGLGMEVLVNSVLFQFSGWLLFRQNDLRQVQIQLLLCICVIRLRLGGILLNYFFVFFLGIVIGIGLLIVELVKLRLFIIFFLVRFRFCVICEQCRYFSVWQLEQQFMYSCVFCCSEVWLLRLLLVCSSLVLFLVVEVRKLFSIRVVVRVSWIIQCLVMCGYFFWYWFGFV